MVEKAESCRACRVLLRLIYSNNKRLDKGNNTNTTEEDNSSLKTKAAFLKASLPVIKGGIKDSPADELDQTQTIENITAKHQRINSTRVDVMQLKPVTPRRDRSVQKYSQRNEQSTPFLYSKDSGGSLLAVESKEYSNNSYMEPQIKGFMSAKKPSNTYFENLINNNIKPREIRTILNPRQTQTQMQMNRSDEVNNSYITSFKTNHDDSKDLKASNKSYLDYLNESSSQYKPKIVIQGKKDVVGQINTGQILTMEPVKGGSEQAVKQDDLSNRGSGRGTDNMLKELYIKDKETAAGRLLEPNSLEGTVKVDDNIEKDSLTDEGIELKDSKENLDSGRKKPLGYNNESFLLDTNMRSSKGIFTQGSQLFRTLRSMKATSQRPQRSILKSPDVRKFYSKGNDDEEARSALFDFLNKTDLNDSLVDGDSRHVSFAANQVSQERVITPSNKGKKVIRITSFAMKGGVNSSSDYFGEGISSLKNILGVNTDNAGGTNKISRQRGRRSYRPMDAKTTKQGLDESGAQDNEQNNDISGVSSASNVIPVVDEKERFTKLMQDHIKKHSQFPRTIVYHDSEITTEKEAYIQRLLAEKPWFERSTLQWYNFEALKENFPLPAEPVVLQGREKQEFDEEIKFIMEKVVPLKDKARDSKSDLELAYDLRYYGRYGDMLLKRIKTRNFYQRLDLAKTCSDSDVKTAFRTKALTWHPDNIKKTFKHCFANEALYASTAASIFSLIDEAYKTLSNANKRTAYNTTTGS